MAKRNIVEEEEEVEVVDESPIPLPPTPRKPPVTSEMTFYSRAANLQKACHKYGPDGKPQSTVIVEFGPDSAMVGTGVYGRATVRDRDIQKLILEEIERAEEMGQTCDILTADQYSLEVRARKLTEENAVRGLLEERDKLQAELNRLKGGGSGSQGSGTFGSNK